MKSLGLCMGPVQGLKGKNIYSYQAVKQKEQSKLKRQKTRL